MDWGTVRLWTWLATLATVSLPSNGGTLDASRGLESQQTAALLDLFSTMAKHKAVMMERSGLTESPHNNNSDSTQEADDKTKNQSPFLKPDNPSSPYHLPYLFPYLFTGAGGHFPNLLPPIPLIPDFKTLAEGEVGKKKEMRDGIEKDLSMEDITDFFTAMIKPLASTKMDDDDKVALVPWVKSRGGATGYVKPNPEAALAELMKYLEASLGTFKDYSSEDGEEEDEDKVRLDLDNVSLIESNSTTVPVKNNGTSGKKKKPSRSRPRPPYGIQPSKSAGSSQHGDLPSSNLFNNILGSLPLPLWAVPRAHWPSFTALIRRVRTNKDPESLPRFDVAAYYGDFIIAEEAPCYPSNKHPLNPSESELPLMSTCEEFECQSLCNQTRLGGGGECFGGKMCLCYFDSDKQSGLVFDKKESTEVTEVKSTMDCVEGCRKSLNAFTGMCWNEGCHCALPWQDLDL